MPNPAYPAALERIPARAKRPIIFRLSLILFPIGLILGTLYVWNDSYQQSLAPQITVGRGQEVGLQRLEDIQGKLSQLSSQPEPKRTNSLTTFLEGTLGSPNNAGLISSRFQLAKPPLNGTWLAFQRQGESRRAGITLFIELPDSSKSNYEEESITKLASTINAVEGLMRLPQAQRDVTLIFHPTGNPLDLPAGELSELQAQLELKGGGELYRLSMAELAAETQTPQLDPAMAVPEGEFGFNDALPILSIEEDGQLIITPNQIHPTEKTTKALHDWLKRRTQ